MEHALDSLSANGRRLAEQLAELPRGWLSAAALAQSVGISRRTVLRELPGLERWCSEAGYRFLRSPGQGLLLDEPPQRRAQLLALLREGAGPAAPAPQVRRQRLLLELLACREPVKSYALSRTLSVSEQTLSGDLDWLRDFLSPYGIVLNRRPGVGVWLSGTPSRQRRAAAALIRGQLPQQELQMALEDGVLPAVLDQQLTRPVWQLLERFEDGCPQPFSDTGFLALAIHISLVIWQVQHGTLSPGGAPGLSPDAPEEILARMIEGRFQLALPDGERSRLALHLRPLRFGGPEEDWSDARLLDLRHLAVCLVEEVSEVLGVDLTRYPSLTDDLCAHLEPMLDRLRQGNRLENPHLELIQTEYRPWWLAVRQACDRVQTRFGLPNIPDGEAGFLTMHFGAVLEQDSAAQMVLRALVVCPYGISTSRFLFSQLQKEFPQLQVLDCCSVRDLPRRDLAGMGVDLIVSTVPLQTAFPYVCVSPILREQDIARLRERLDRLRAAHRAATEPEPVFQPDALRYTLESSGALLELLETLRIQTAPFLRTREQLIRRAAALFCGTPEDQRAVEEALLRRERLSSTYIRPLEALLLHCKTSAVRGCRFGYLHAEPPLTLGSGPCSGALVLLAPEADEMADHIMRGVSEILIEQPELMCALRAGNVRQASAILEHGLSIRFRRALRQQWRQSRL